MGVVLTPIITKETLALADLNGRMLAVDGNGDLYQFHALIRLRDGTPLQDSKGRTTSHLSGLFYRTTRLIAEHALKLVFVFDGPPPAVKAREIAKRRAIKNKYEDERASALARGDLAEAYSKSTMTSRLTKDMISEARELLRLMGERDVGQIEERRPVRCAGVQRLEHRLKISIQIGDGTRASGESGLAMGDVGLWNLPNNPTRQPLP